MYSEMVTWLEDKPLMRGGAMSWSCQACLVSRGIVIYMLFLTQRIWQHSVSFFISCWDKIAGADHHWIMCYTCNICVICMLEACYSLETLYTRNSSHHLDSQTSFWHLDSHWDTCEVLLASLMTVNRLMSSLTFCLLQWVSYDLKINVLKESLLMPHSQITLQSLCTLLITYYLWVW